jgi:hypothetical protein
LLDLTKRENRFAHRPFAPGANSTSPAFPHLLERRLLVPRGTTLLPGNDGGPGKAGADDNGDGTNDDVWEAGWFGTDDVSDRDPVNVSAYGYGTDVVLSDVLAFDVRAYDPEAEVRVNNGVPVVPGDPGWSSGTPMNPKVTGAFVDLNYLAEPYSISNCTSNFSGYPAFRDLNNNGQWNPGEPFLGVPCMSPNGTSIGTSYCSWSMHYERDGFDQDGLYGVDQGTDGLDNDLSNGIDDPGENETSAPYPVELRGIQVKIRLYEPDTRQVRQVTVIGKFTDQ